MYYVTHALLVHASIMLYATLGNVMGAFFKFARANRDYDTQLGVELSIRRWLFGFDWLDKPDHFLVAFYFFGLHVKLSAFPKEPSQ